MFNPAEFIMDAFFQRELIGATWNDVLKEFVELNETERTSLLELIRNAPDDMPEAFTKFLIYNLEDPSHAEAMIRAIEEGLVDMSSLQIVANTEEEVICDAKVLA